MKLLTQWQLIKWENSAAPETEQTGSLSASQPELVEFEKILSSPARRWMQFVFASDCVVLTTARTWEFFLIGPRRKRGAGGISCDGRGPWVANGRSQ